MNAGGGPDEPAKAAELGYRLPTLAVLQAVQRLADDLAIVPDLGRPDGWTDEEMRLSRMGESLGAVLNFLEALNVPVAGRIPLLEALQLVVDQKPRQRGGQKRNSGLLCIAIQRLTLAGMTEAEAIKDVSDKRIVRENIAANNASLAQVKKYWAGRAKEESWQDYQKRGKPSMTVEQALSANDLLFADLGALAKSE